MTSTDARLAFDADPQATLEHAGLGDVHATDVLHAASLMLDYAPLDVVHGYEHSLHGSFQKFAAASSGAVPISESTPSVPQDNNTMELSMLKKGPDHDHDHRGQQPAPPPAHEHHDHDRVTMVEKDSHNGIDVHDNQVLSGNSVNFLSKGSDEDHDDKGHRPDHGRHHKHHDDHDHDRVHMVQKDSHNGMDVHDNHVLSGNSVDPDASTVSPASFAGAFHSVTNSVSGAAAGGLPTPAEGPAALGGALENGAHEFAAATSGVPVAGNVTASMASGADTLNATLSQVASGGLPSPSEAPAALASALENGAHQFADATSGVPVVGQVTATMASGSETFAGTLSGLASGGSGLASGGLPNPADGPAALGGALENGAHEFAAATSGLPVIGSITASMASGAETLNATLSQAASGGLPNPAEGPAALGGALENGAHEFAAATSGVPVVGQVTATMANGADTLSGSLSGVTAGGLPNPAEGPAALSGALENGAHEFAAATSGVPVVGQVTATMANGADTLSGSLSGVTAGGLPNPADGPAAATDALSGVASGHLPSPSEVPVVGNVVGGVAGNLPIAGGGLPSPSNVPVVGDVAGTVTSHLPVGGDPAAAAHALPAVPASLPVAGNLPVAGDLAGHLPAGAATGAVDNVTEHLDTVHTQVDAVASHLPVHDVTSHLPVHDVTSHLPVGEVASHVPNPNTVVDALPTHQAPLNVVAEPAENGLHHAEGLAGHTVNDHLGLDLH